MFLIIRVEDSINEFKRCGLLLPLISFYMFLSLSFHIVLVLISGVFLVVLSDHYYGVDTHLMLLYEILWLWWQEGKEFSLTCRCHLSNIMSNSILCFKCFVERILLKKVLMQCGPMTAIYASIEIIFKFINLTL